MQFLLNNTFCYSVSRHSQRVRASVLYSCIQPPVHKLSDVSIKFGPPTCFSSRTNPFNNGSHRTTFRIWRLILKCHHVNNCIEPAKLLPTIIFLLVLTPFVYGPSSLKVFEYSSKDGENSKKIYNPIVEFIMNPENFLPKFPDALKAFKSFAAPYLHNSCLDKVPQICTYLEMV